MREEVARVLVYRLGSLGDTVVALPALHLIARAFPNAERAMLTNIPVHAKAPAAAAVLGDSGLVHYYFRYPIGLRDPRLLFGLMREIRAWGPEVLVYLAGYRGFTSVIRDAAYFRLCGVRRIVGLPFRTDLRGPLHDVETDRWEGEWHRLLRCLRELGEVNPDDPASWDLRLTVAEIEAGRQATAALGETPFIACSVGTKVKAKDWGEANWDALIRRIAPLVPGFGLVMVGAPEEAERSDCVAASWPGAVLNLCGRLTPRVSAEVLSRAALFVGHDSGPMHLAALGSTPCVAIFAARNLPGQWYPYGPDHRVLYHKTQCFGCGLEVCLEQAMKCLRAITVDEVYGAVEEVVRLRKLKLKSTAELAVPS